MRHIRWPKRPEHVPLREGSFTSKLHDQRTAAWLGIALGIAFATCFATGLLSHLIQDPPGWFTWPARPAGLYRVTQGVHVATGIAAIPLLLAKLWVVYPHLWTWPPLRSIAHAVERVSLVPLVGGAVFLLTSGLLNTAGWYPWAFFFPAAHYWAAWITVGALVVHLAAKFPITRAATKRSREADVHEPASGVSRRAFLGWVGAAVATVTAVTVGQTWYPLRGLAVLAPRDPAVGPQGFPVNKSALGAGVSTSARDPQWRLLVEGRVGRRIQMTLDQLRAMPQREAELPIACVEGWSATARWRGVRVRDVLELAEAEPDRTVRVESLQRRGRYRASELNPGQVEDDDTLLALEVNGEPLHIDHGYPLRLIGPNRPGVQQTKWLSKLVVT